MSGSYPRASLYELIVTTYFRTFVLSSINPDAYKEKGGCFMLRVRIDARRQQSELGIRFRAVPTE